MVETLKAALAAKDTDLTQKTTEVATLTAAATEKDTTITTLTAQVTSLTQEKTDLTALVEANKKLNTDLAKLVRKTLSSAFASFQAGLNEGQQAELEAKLAALPIDQLVAKVADIRSSIDIVMTQRQVQPVANPSNVKVDDAPEDANGKKAPTVAQVMKSMERLFTGTRK